MPPKPPFLRPVRTLPPPLPKTSLCLMSPKWLRTIDINCWANSSHHSFYSQMGGGVGWGSVRVGMGGVGGELGFKNNKNIYLHVHFHAVNGISHTMTQTQSVLIFSCSTSAPTPPPPMTTTTQSSRIPISTCRTSSLGPSHGFAMVTRTVAALRKLLSRDDCDLGAVCLP